MDVLANYGNQNHPHSAARNPSPARTVSVRQDAAENGVGGCECGDLPVMAYVPVQEIRCVYDPMEAYRQGTLYPELDKPFMKGGACCGK